MEKEISELKEKEFTNWIDIRNKTNSIKEVLRELIKYVKRFQGFRHFPEAGNLIKKLDGETSVNPEASGSIKESKMGSIPTDGTGKRLTDSKPSEQELISEFLEDLNKIDDIGNEHHKDEHYYGTIVNNVIRHYIWKWEKRL